MMQNKHTICNRREFLAATGAIFGASALSSSGLFAAPTTAPSLLKGKAKSCIFMWLGGGMSHIDTFDPKQRGDPKKKLAGSYYDSIETAVKGVRVCEHLKRTAPLMDRITSVRTLHHEVIDEHAAATNRMHT